MLIRAMDCSIHQTILDVLSQTKAVESECFFLVCSNKEVDGGLMLNVRWTRCGDANETIVLLEIIMQRIIVKREKQLKLRIV